MVQGASERPPGGLSVVGGPMWHAVHSVPRLGIGIPDTGATSVPGLFLQQSQGQGQGQGQGQSQGQ